MKNMKRFSAVVGAAALFAVAFTGCSNFAGTEVDYGQNEITKTGNTGNNVVTSIIGASVTVTNTIATASARSTVSVTINNSTGTNTRINLDSAKEAIKFYTLKDNGTTGYLFRDAELPKPAVFSVTEGSNSTTIEFELNTSSVTKNKIALFVDATKLKDKKGSAILNDDGNYKAGEETDSILKAITVNYKADKTTATESLTGTWLENLSPDFTLAGITGTPTIHALTGTDTYATGEYEVRVTANAYHQTAYNDTAAINKNLAGKLSSAYKVLYRKPGSTSVETLPLSFSWDETNNYYKASAGKPELGTVYELQTEFINISDIAPTFYKDYCGAPAFTKQEQVGRKTVGASGTVTVAIAEPDYIVGSYSTAAYTAPVTAATWHPTTINPQAAQRTFLSVTGSAATKYRVSLPTVGDLEFASDKLDFLLIAKPVETTTVDLEVKLPIKYSFKKNDANVNDKLNYVEIEVTDKNLDLNKFTNITLYVGNGTALKANAVSPKQVKFGTYKDVADGIRAGYVALN